MIFLLAGEGPSDMGHCCNGENQCCGTDFEAGPMAVLVKQIAERVAGFELSEEAIEFVGHAVLEATPPPRTLPQSGLFLGKKAKRKTDDVYFFREAELLGRLANQRAVDERTPVAAVLFHDADGRRSTKRGLWRDKWHSMEAGFTRANCERGVPMVANPTSEAWLLCGMKTVPYQNCAALETTVSASDKSPHCGKKLLNEAIEAAGAVGYSFAALVRDSKVDAHRIEMPSYSAFKERLTTVVIQMVQSV